MLRRNTTKPEKLRSADVADSDGTVRVHGGGRWQTLSLEDARQSGALIQRWSRLAGQDGGLAKVDSGFDYAANLSSFACVA